MLRITVRENPQTVTVVLEGKLAASCLPELRECWHRIMMQRPASTVRVDLAGVTFVDEAGKALLAEMHRRPAELIATDCLTKEIVREIIEECS